MPERLRVLVLVNNFPDTDQPYAGVFVLRQLEALREHSIEARVVRFVAYLNAIRSEILMFESSEFCCYPAFG
jgi:hypothetical protein